MKYRVQKLTLADGTEEFYPQHKSLFFWSNCYVLGYYVVCRDSFQEAEDWIRNYELDKLNKKLEKQRKRVIKCEHIPLENQ